MNRPRVFVADDHKLLADGLRKVLEPACEVVGMAANGRELIKEAPAAKPDVILLDISMPLLNGLDAARQLRRILPQAKLIIITMNEDPDLASAAFELGVSGYLLKSSAAIDLVQAIHIALEGGQYVAPSIREGLEQSFVRWGSTHRPSRPLTSRQREIVQLLAEGHTMKEAARVLKVTPRTVAFHKYRVMELHGLKSNADLIQLALGLKLIATAPRPC